MTKSQEVTTNLQEATLKNWSFNEHGGLKGFAYGPPRFEDNTLVSTTTVRYINREKGFAVTGNTVYFLEGEAK